MSNTEANGQSITQVSKKAKMSGDTTTLHLDGIPPDTLSKVQNYLDHFQLSLEKLHEVSVRLEKDLVRGLGKHSHHRAAVKMLPTFVRATPDGTEKGDFLALDLGGTNFRVLHVRVVEEEQRVLKMDSQICAIPQEIMLGTGEQLFDHIAACLGDFLDSQDLKRQTLPLGFTFSFPCEQKEIDKSILIRWTKGFNCSGVEGKDVVKLLKEAIHRRGDYDIGSVAMVNDTVGTMMSCGYKDQSCEIGMIIGTGTNACYMEEMKNVKRVEGEDGRMCINTEWGGFGDGDNGSLKDIQTEFDRMVDKMSINPGVHTFEKMISGMYLGEIVRLLLVRLTEERVLFNGQTSEALQTPGRFVTKFISEIEEEDRGLENAQDILTELGLKWTPVDVRVVRLVCDTISSRSARLCAAALATIANRIRVNRGLDHLKTTVGVDGTVYRKHPNFSEKLQATVRLLAPKCSITFLVSEDGSGKGAAMVTAVAQRLALQSRLLEDSDGEDEEEEEEDK
ncbi:hexokinase-4-like [Toxotes jaculatrix]|uniref:hexokinase-4-like n=1 Tax=Toxotes jaculatrix TaxID=941984 RepID=UPI001B3AF708|nr:hexokinase-4-like [Toxotes jaculatrix]XP_040908440.1 hexokinase-4-like [Toxotes jaculatrix]